MIYRDTTSGLEMNFEKKMLVFEFYSGIGGWHQAFNLVSQTDFFVKNWKSCSVKVAFDINANANEIYKLNYKNTVVETKSIEHLDANYFDRILKNIFKGALSQQINGSSVYSSTLSMKSLEEAFAVWRSVTTIVWALSPPCQAYTRGGRQQDIDDPRSQSFVHLLQKILPQLREQPDIMLVENVYNFERSHMRDFMLKKLNENGFSFIEEYLFCPNRLLKWPNERLRYYMIASRRKSHYRTYFSIEDFEALNLHFNDEIEYLKALPDYSGKHFIGDFVLKDKNNDQSLYLQEELISILCGSKFKFEVVGPTSMSSCCITKGYGCKKNKFVKGSGPLYTQKEAKYEKYISEFQVLKSLNVRRFHPDEIKSLLGFPSTFNFGEQTQEQQIRMLGNSVNVYALFLIVLKAIQSIN